MLSCSLHDVTSGLTNVRLFWITQAFVFVHNVREQKSRRLAFQREIAAHLGGLEHTSQINIKHIFEKRSHFAFKYQRRLANKRNGEYIIAKVFIIIIYSFS